MKALFVGDVHNHSYIFDDIKKLDDKYKFDRIIFMGDYVDDWNTDNHKSLETLDTIFNLKSSNPEKYTLLIGNHELSYLGYKCSGHVTELEDVMESKLKEHIDDLDFYTSIICGDREYICTHAGITNEYIDNILDGENNWRKVLDEMNNNKLKSLYLLTLCSYNRGGSNSFGSFVWTDLREFVYYNTLHGSIIPNQIIGHTPVKKVTLIDTMYFVDTHSTHNNGTELGNKSYLMWNENKFEIINNKKGYVNNMGNDDFINICKEVVQDYTNEHLDKTDNIQITKDDTFIVWSCKTLQNNKALVSTKLSDGMYYELTYNGDKEELYLDAYKKFENRCIKLKK